MAAFETLYGEALRAAVVPWLEEVGRADRERLEALVRISSTDRIKLADCVKAAFPELVGKKGVTALTSFRKRINDAANAAKPALNLRFEVDTRKQTPPEERECWFTGPDPAVAIATRYSEQVTGDVAGQPFVPPLGIATTGKALESGKRLVRFFLSYAHADRKLVDSFRSEFEKQYGGAARYEYEVWSDREIPVGAKWRTSIDSAIQACDFGLLLVSPAFFGSKFIQKHEFQHFVGEGAGKLVLPVGLAKVDPKVQDLRGLEEHQIFLLGEGRFFGELQGTRQKGSFAHELFKKVQERLDAFFEPRQRVEQKRELDEMVPYPERVPHFQPPRGTSVVLGDLEKEEALRSRQGRDALGEIEAWAVKKEDSFPFFALLGEYGIGKTTTLKHLTRNFLERRKAGEDLPLPLYIDLRDFVSPAKDAVPTLEELLGSIIQRSWKLRDRSVTPEAVIRLVREEGAVILFDGLDERIVHLTPDRARDFIRTLWSVLPDASRPADSLQRGKRRGKLLISCRSHYFRDVWSQNGMLVGQGREGMDPRQFPAFCLVPFSEEQIRSYLTSLLGTAGRAGAAIELIASTHDLSDLARRPVLLPLIAEKLTELEQLKVRGETVNAARLYDLVVRKWLTRDDGKHQLDPMHKRRLMEALAAALWRSGSKQWSADRLEEWLDEHMAASPALTGAYANKDRAILKEDLRTATFVLRPDTEREQFRFAHTSLQEYFLASHLARALEDGRQDAFRLPMVSNETLDFLGQILSLGQHPRALRTMEAILGGDSLDDAVFAFRYWLRALEGSLPVPSPSKVNLARADLEEWTIRGPIGQPPLNLRGANLSGVKLNRARVENVDLTEGNLDGLEARQALFLGIHGARASARDVDFSGLQWREGSLQSADLTGARLAGCHWLGVDLSLATLPDGWQRKAATVVPPGQSYPASLTLPLGHSYPIRACAWSPDGQRLLSASDDNTLKVWDSSSGKCLLSLNAHSRPVLACAWSPDGQRLLSASLDNTLKVWDSSSGKCLLTLNAHSRPVNACAWSPDGQRLLSASSDNTLKVWDSSSGTCLLTAQTLPEGQTASIDEPLQRVIHASPEAWRWLAWRVTDPDTGQLRLLPYESLAPLPDS